MLMVTVVFYEPAMIRDPTVLFEPDTSKRMVAVLDPSTDPPVNTLSDPESLIVVYDSYMLVALPVQCELITLVLESIFLKVVDTWNVMQASPKRAVVILLSI